MMLKFKRVYESAERVFIENLQGVGYTRPMFRQTCKAGATLETSSDSGAPITQVLKWPLGAIPFFHDGLSEQGLFV